MDNLSSTFSDSDPFSNNNGQFNTGYLDPYAPMLDKGSSDFDIRQRISMAAIWDIPAFRTGKGLAHQILGGWELAPIFTARTGSPYSIFDSTNGLTLTPRAFLGGPVGPDGNGNGPSAGVNLFNYLTIPTSLIDHPTNPVFFYTDLPPFPPGMIGRNAFRAPGVWDLDLGVYKSFSLTERLKLQVRGEAFDLMNHSNLYVIGTSADLANAPATGSYSITSCRGGCNGTINDRRNIQLAVKLTF
jgi:hypothetical protein